MLRMQGKRRYDQRLPAHVDAFAPRIHANNSGAYPAKVDLNDPPLPSPFNPSLQQGQEGSCGPNTLAEDIVQDYLAAGQSIKLPSRQFLYWCTRKLMGTLSQDSGVDNQTMGQALTQYGWCDEETWPYSMGWQVEPSPAAFAQAQTRAGSTCLSVPQDLEHVHACLAGGEPFWLGFTVYQSMETPQVDATGMVPVPRPGEAVLGGHDVLACGYSDDRQLVKFKNSWGAAWGDSGYGYLPYTYIFNQRMAGDWWLRKRKPVPTPPPEPVPTGRSIIFTPGAFVSGETGTYKVA